MNTRHFAFWPPGMSRGLPPVQKTLHAAFEESVRRTPDKVILRFQGTALTYREAQAQVNALAAHLQLTCGVRPGDRVLVDLQNSAHFVIALYAVLRVDAVVVPVSPANLADELTHYLADSDARVAIVGEEVQGRFA